jgi:hypothetical protein
LPNVPFSADIPSFATSFHLGVTSYVELLEVNGSDLKRALGVKNEKCVIICDPKIKITTTPIAYMIC